jgi:hypothetical protein
MASPDWTVQAADTIETVVVTIRDKTAVPLETITRAIVYGILVVVMGSTALVLSAIALVRLASYFVDVWIAYAVIGGLFTLAGMLAWRTRRPRGER